MQALGMDGFHYPNAALETYTTVRGGKEISLKSIKGAPETFDVAALAAKLGAAREESVTFPVYDRRIHDVVPNAVTADAPILLVEGNWLLLDEEPWSGLRLLASSPARCRGDSPRRRRPPSARRAMPATSNALPHTQVRRTRSGA